MLQRFLTTANIDGKLDFISNLIQLNNYDFRHKDSIETLIGQDIQTLILDNNFKENVISTIYHEITHFLDLTTTLWGLEYNTRKLFFIKNQILTKENVNAFDVFKLNVSEIEIHKDLIEEHTNTNDISLLDCTLKHKLIYHEHHGSLIMIEFFDDDTGNSILSVPWSMLSLLEANAISTEYLVKLNCVKNESTADRKGSLKKIEKDFDKMLNNHEFSEYNLILILIKKHFTFLSLKELLIFTKVLIKYILNLGSMDISMVSTLIKHTNLNTHIGDAIVKDMQRGMSRHIVLFKFIFMIHAYMLPNKDYKFNNKHDFKYNPRLFLKHFIDEYIKKHLEYFDADFLRGKEHQMFLESIKECKDILDAKIILESYDINHPLLENKFEFEYNLTDLKLLDIFLNEGNLDVIEFPNKININTKEYFDKNTLLLNKIEKLFKESDMTKFHIHPDDVTHV